MADAHLDLSLPGGVGVHPGGQNLVIGVGDRCDAGALLGIERQDRAVGVAAGQPGIRQQFRIAEQKLVALLAFQRGIHLGLQQGIFE